MTRKVSDVLHLLAITSVIGDHRLTYTSQTTLHLHA